MFVFMSNVCDVFFDLILTARPVTLSSSPRMENLSEFVTQSEVHSSSGRVYSSKLGIVNHCSHLDIFIVRIQA